MSFTIYYRVQTVLCDQKWMRIAVVRSYRQTMSTLNKFADLSVWSTAPTSPSIHPSTHQHTPHHHDHQQRRSRKSRGLQRPTFQFKCPVVLNISSALRTWPSNEWFRWCSVILSITLSAVVVVVVVRCRPIPFWHSESSKTSSKGALSN